MIDLFLLFPGESTWIDVTHLIRAETYTQEEQIINDELASVIDTASCKLLYDQLLVAKFLSLEPGRKVYAKVFRNGDPHFYGYVATGFEHKSDEFQEDIPLELRDNTWRLDTKIPEDLQYPSSIDDPGISIGSLFESLLVRAGYEQAEIDPDVITSVTKKVRMVSIRANRQTYRNVLDEVLREYGYVLTTRPDGMLTLFKWDPDILTPKGTVSENISTVSPFTVTKQDTDHDGILLSWPKAGVLDSVCLYQDSLPIGSDGIPSGKLIEPGGYYPGDSDITEVYQTYRSTWLDRPYQEKTSRIKNEDISLVSSDHHELVWRSDSGITATATYEAQKAKVVFHNPTTEPLKLFVFEIWGRALYRHSIQETFLPSSAANPQSVEAYHLFTQDDAKLHAKRLHEKQCFGTISYQFELFEDLYNPGDIIHLTQTDPPIDTDVQITQKRWTDEIPGIGYQAVGISEFGDIQAITSSYYTSRNTQKGEKGDDAIILVVVSTNGNIFRPALTDTTLEARVYQGAQEITDRYDPSRFRWTRTSDDSYADDVWNSAHYSAGSKSIQITDEDVEHRATFFCELI
jgi:hypothetical protein